MLARIVGHLDPAGSLDPDVWLQTLTLARLIEGLSSESGVAAALRGDIRDYLEQLPGSAEGNTPRLRLHHEVIGLLLAGSVEPLTATEIEELGLSPWDESEEA
jgi:hypothetical protein